MGVHQPGRGTGGGRAQDHADAVLVRAIHRPAQPTGIEPAILGFQARPGEVADPDGVEAEFPHQAQVLVDHPVVPMLGIPGRAETQLRCGHALNGGPAEPLGKHPSGRGDLRTV